MTDGPKEHGFLFTGEMVNKIRERQKLQTRRIVTPHNSLVNGYGMRKGWEFLDWSRARIDRGPSPAGNPGPYYHVPWREPSFGDDPPIYRVYPRVQVGDLIWVRETFAIETNRGLDDEEHYPPPFSGSHPIRRVSYTEDPGWGPYWEQPHYRADGYTPELAYEDRAEPGVKWRPSIFMRKWAARLWLTVIRVRTQRIQEISERDAIAEGAGSPVTRDCKRPAFQRLWDSINRKRGFGWAKNPRVWVYDFEIKSCAGAGLKS